MNTIDEVLPLLTPRANQVILLAQKAAMKQGWEYVSSEHLMIGILKLREGSGVFRALESSGCDTTKLLETLEANTKHA